MDWKEILYLSTLFSITFFCGLGIFLVSLLILLIARINSSIKKTNNFISQQQENFSEMINEWSWLAGPVGTVMGVAASVFGRQKRKAVENGSKLKSIFQAIFK